MLFQVLGSRKVVADFSGGALSSDGGLLLLRQVDSGLGISGTIAKCFTDARDPMRVEHSVSELVRLTRVNSPDADIVLLSTFPPNTEWQIAKHRMAEYAAATREAASANACAYADVFAVWEKVLRRKDQPSLLANNINHPSNFGRWLYFQALTAMGL